MQGEPVGGGAVSGAVAGQAEGAERGTVYFLGGGLLDLSPSSAVRLWLYGADLVAAHEELRGRGVDVVRPPVKEP